MNLRIVMPSIIDPVGHRGGAGATTRTLIKLLQSAPLKAEIAAVPANTEREVRRGTRQIFSVARSLVSSWPAKAEFVRSGRFLRSVRNSLDTGDADLVMLNGSDLLWLLPELPPEIPTILIAHNIEHDLHLSHVERLDSSWRFLQRTLLRDWRRLREYEMSGTRRIHNVVFLSSRDAEIARRECADINAIVVPPLFDYSPQGWSRARDSDAELHIGFLGHFGWWPNRDGLRWFLTEVFPFIRETTRLHLFGEQSKHVVRADPRIIAHGFIPRLEHIWPMCDLMICPMFAGGGVSVKFAETVYNGVPVVASSFSARGMPLEPHPSVVLLDHADEWIRFLRSPAAKELTRLRGPTRNAKVFEMSSHIAPVHEFVAGVAQQRVLVG